MIVRRTFGIALLVALLLAGVAEAVVRTNPITHPPKAARLSAGAVIEPLNVSEVAPLSSACSVVAAEGDLMVAGGTGTGLTVLTRDGSGFRVRGSVQLPAPPLDAVVVAERAYVACAWGGTAVIDLSRPDTPASLAVLPSGSSARSVAVSDGHLYVANWTSGLQVIRLPEGIGQKPRVLNFADTAGHAYDVAVVGKLAYVADFDGGVRVFDISTPSSPKPAGTWQSIPAPTGLVARGDLIYAADEQRGIFVVDVSKPSAPQIVSDVRTEVAAHDVEVAGERLLVSDLAGGVSLFDISSPDAPRPLGRTQLADQAVGLAAIGNDAYFGAGRLLRAEVGK